MVIEEFRNVTGGRDAAGVTGEAAAVPGAVTFVPGARVEVTGVVVFAGAGGAVVATVVGVGEYTVSGAVKWTSRPSRIVTFASYFSYPSCRASTSKVPLRLV
jgi:hypothetical protein